MTTIEKVTDQRRDVLDYLLRDPIGNGFALEDLRHMPRDVEFFVFVGNGRHSIKGYILNHYESTNAFIFLKGDTENVISELVDLLPQDRRTSLYINTDPNYEKTIREFLNSKQREFNRFTEHLMAVKRNEARLIHPNPAIIVPEKLAREVAKLYSESGEIVSDDIVEITRIALSERKIWGIIINEKVVAAAGIASKQPEVAFVTSVLTHPDFRRRGLGTLVTSAATGDALRSSEVASLYVSTSNYEARSIYEKLGYRMIKDSAKFEVKQE